MASSAASGGMWPQSTREEVHAAQQQADAGNPDATWQIGTELSLDDPWAHLDELEIIDRFLLEVLGWEEYLLNSWDSGDEGNGGGDGWVGGRAGDLEFLRCAPGITNPLYPPDPDGQPATWLTGGTSCAPTIDDLHYESVRIDLAQLDRHGLDGIWVVNEWTMTAPFAQADPTVVEAAATERVQAFLSARIAGEHAEGYVQAGGAQVGVPLLYATTSGAPYERYEIERLDGPRWPDGSMTFSSRLYARHEATAVDQIIEWQPSSGLWIDANSTTESGQPIMLSHTSGDGEVTLSAPSTWAGSLPGKGGRDADAWIGSFWRHDEWPHRERIDLVDPVAYDARCARSGGSPVLTGPADAAAIVREVIGDPDFETTAPVMVRVGGIEAVSIDVTLAPGGRACGVVFDVPGWIHELEYELGARLRLYLVDLPAGMSVETLAITVLATEDRFDEVVAETAPIIASIEFHPG